MAVTMVIVVATDFSNVRLSGAKLYAYAAGTTTPRAMYTDSGLGTATANPLIMDASGRGVAWLDSTLGDYKLVLKDSGDINTYFSQDNITPGTNPEIVVMPGILGDQSLQVGDSPTFAGLTVAGSTPTSAQWAFLAATSAFGGSVMAAADPAAGRGLLEIVDQSVTFASQAEAETGTNNTKSMNPLRTSQAIAALAPVKLADLASNANGLGASLLGIEDAANTISATTVEGALAELAASHTAVASIAALTALTKATLVDGERIKVAKYYAAAPGGAIGGGGEFIWDASSTVTEDLGTVFESDEGGSGRWLRDTSPHASNFLDLAWYGIRLTPVASAASPVAADVAHNDLVLWNAMNRKDHYGVTIHFPRMEDADGDIIAGFVDFATQRDVRRESTTDASPVNVRWVTTAGGGNAGPRVRWIGNATDAEHTLTSTISSVEGTATTVGEYTSCWMRFESMIHFEINGIDFCYGSDVENAGADKTDFMFIIDSIPISTRSSSIEWAFRNCTFETPDTSLIPTNAYVWILNSVEGEFDNCNFEGGVSGTRPSGVLLGQWNAKWLVDFTDTSHRAQAGGSSRNIRFRGGHIYAGIRYRRALSVVFENVPFTSETVGEGVTEDNVDATYGTDAYGRDFTFIGCWFGGAAAKYTETFLSAKYLMGLNVVGGRVTGYETCFNAATDCDGWHIEGLTANYSAATDTGAGSNTFKILNVESSCAVAATFHCGHPPEVDPHASDPVTWGALVDNRTSQAARGDTVIYKTTTNTKTLTASLSEWTELTATIVHEGGPVAIRAQVHFNNTDTAQQIFRAEITIGGVATHMASVTHIPTGARNEVQLFDPDYDLAPGSHTVRLRVQQAASTTSFGTSVGTVTLSSVVRNVSYLTVTRI